MCIFFKLPLKLSICARNERSCEEKTNGSAWRQHQDFFNLNYKTNQRRLLNEKYFIVFSTLCSLQLYEELTIWLPDFLIIVILSHHLTAFFCNTTLGSKPDYSSVFSTDTHLHMLFTELNRKTDNKLCVSFCSYHKPLSRIGRLHLLTKTHKHIQYWMQ